MIQKTLTVVLMAVLISFVSACGDKGDIGVKPPQPSTGSPVVPKTKKEEQKEKIKEEAKKAQSVTVDTRTIATRKFGGLYAEITGISGTVGTEHVVNFGERLSYLWHKKLDRKNVSEDAVREADKPIARFLAEPKKMTLKEFVAEADAQVSLVKKHLDTAQACRGYMLSDAECAMFRRLAQSVRGVYLVAYGMTELMPTTEGDLNVKVMEILLRNAGSNYLLTIPAMYDKMLSLGLYQFTSYAVNGVTKDGASKMNLFLPVEVRIPGSVIELQNGQHHRAAYLLALHNFALLAKQTNKKEFQALGKALKEKPGDIVTYMAVAHHAPRPAVASMRRWLAYNAKGPLNDHLRGGLKPYGEKSDNNLRSLGQVV